MTTRFIKLHGALTGAALGTLALTGTAHATPTATTVPVTTWAFCGIHPDAPNAWLSMHNLAKAGIDAVLGPCLPADATYTTAEPGIRYATPLVYKRMLGIAASVGVKTVVYDARIWSSDRAVQQEAIDYWLPSISHVAAWDMGDEFDPQYADWQTLMDRFQTVLEIVEPATGVMPYTNHLPNEAILDRALVDFGTETLSFDSYDLPVAYGITDRFAPQTSELTVAVNALGHWVGVPTPRGITDSMHEFTRRGADRFLIFGGGFPYNADLTPDAKFGGTSLVDPDGHATAWGPAVLAGAQP